MTRCQLRRCRRDSWRMVRYFESRTSSRARRRVTLPSISGCSSVWRSPQLSHSKRGCSHTRVVGRLRRTSRTSTRRVSWTFLVFWPQARQRTALRVSATSITSSSISSVTTRTTFMRRRCSRTVIPSVATDISPRRTVLRGRVVGSGAQMVDGEGGAAHTVAQAFAQSLRVGQTADSPGGSWTSIHSSGDWSVQLGLGGGCPRTIALALRIAAPRNIRA